MEDIINIIQFGDFAENVMDMMLLHSNVLEEMAEHYYHSDDVLDAIKKNMNLFIKNKLGKTFASSQNLIFPNT